MTINDVTQLKSQYDMRLIVEADLGPPSCRGGKALLWRCPFHNEHKGYSLAVWEDGWRCFGACNIRGDLFDWLQRYRGLSFSEACDYLGADKESKRAVKPYNGDTLRKRQLIEAQPPKPEWQNAARALVDRAESALWSPIGARALGYLRKRGLSEETILNARLGYVPGRAWEWLRLESLTVPCGITIPWLVGHELWAVKVRRAAGTPKYTQIAGGSSQGLYNAARLEGYDTVLFVEGEFDTLLAEQVCEGMIGVATLGSAAGTLNPHWMPLLLHCKTILVAYDADEAGLKGAARLQALTKRARVIQVPWGKDISEFVLSGGKLKPWLSELL